MKQNQLKFAWLAVIILFLMAASLLMQPAQVHAQVTATFTATSAPTNTPTATATPIATQLPMVSGAQGLYNGVRVGNYAVPTPQVSGDAFQSTVGGISLYSSVGRQTFHVDNATGNVTAYGSITANGGTPVAVTSGVIQSETANTYLKCGSTNVTNSATFTPVAGATPSQIMASLGAAPAGVGDADYVAGIYAGGVFTLTAGQDLAGTPTANTTPVAVKWCYVYSK